MGEDASGGYRDGELALRGEPVQPGVTGLAATVQGVDFVRAPAHRHADRDQRYVGAAILLGAGVWSAVLAGFGDPVLSSLAALVWLEFALSGFRVARVTGAVVEDNMLALRLAPVLVDVCRRLGCALPRVALRDDALRPVFVRRSRGVVMLTLSQGLALRLNDAELRGIIAHEIAHVAYGDLDRSQRRGMWVSVLPLAPVPFLLLWVPDVATRVGTPVWLAGWLVARVALSAAFAPSNRPRETRCDDVAAALCGDATAVALALEKVTAMGQESRAAVSGRRPWRWLLKPLSWTMPSHPALSRRTAHLLS